MQHLKNKIMASRKNLKKSIKYICNVLEGVCLIDAAQAPAEKRSEYGDLYVKINDFQNEPICKINHTEPGSVKLFYKKLKEDCNKGIEEIASKLDELGK